MTRNTRMMSLLPVQARALDAVELELRRSAHVGLVGMGGAGKSLVARALAERHDDARWLSLDNYLESAGATPHDKWADRFFPTLHQALRLHRMLIIDDYMYALGSVIDSGRAEEERRLLCREAEALGHKLVMIGRPTLPEWETDLQEQDELRAAGNWYGTPETPLVHLSGRLMPEDLAALAGDVLGAGRIAQVDFEAIHIHAAHLRPRTLRMVCSLFGPSESVTTQAFFQKINNYILGDHLGLAQVEALTFEDLPGTEEIARALETHVVMPFQNPAAATAMGVRAQRGVMLFGPPGTGKTSVGRALAHRLKGKFFLIDGAIPTEPPQRFLARTMALIDRAIANAPSVIFIDDADNLLSIPYVAGVVRKLLSLLDGVESESAAKVCVMMTVMDPVHIPDALLRSGRVELWLETKAPPPETRAAMFASWNSAALPGHEDLAIDVLSESSPGFTPADIRRVMSDARLLYARDVRKGKPTRDATAYALEAISELIAMRAKMAGVLHDDNLRLGQAQILESAA